MSAPRQLVNNLLNITTDDAVFWAKAKTIAEKALERLEERDARLLLQSYPQLAVVAGDSYFLHYSILPLLRDRNPDQLLNEVLEEQRKYVTSPDFSRVRTITKLSDLFSTIHAVAFTAEFARRLMEELRKQQPPEQYRQLLEQLQRLAQQQLAQGAGGQGGQQPPQRPQGQQQGGTQQQSGRVAQGGQQQLARQKQTAQQAGQSQQPQQQSGQQPQQGAGGQTAPLLSSSRPPPGVIVDYWPSSGGGFQLPLPSGAVGKAFKDALDAAERAARAAKDIADVVGVGKEPGSLDLLLDLTGSVFEVKGAEKILVLAKKTVDVMPFFVRQEKERHRRFGDEIAGYYLTKNPERALPRELALPDELFFAKLAGGGLLAREKLSPREGAIYVLLDKSGSMSGEKTVWARSVALALLALARRKRARFFLRFFDTRAYDLVTDEKPERLLELLLRVESNGGTSIDTALQTAIEDLAERGLSKLTNTIIIITDGEDRVETRRRELERVGARLVSVMIRGSNETLKRISDQYLKAELSAEGALKLIEVVRK
ncbi:MAG: VWA domain-containing protein [Thermofilum sp.]|nr:VWA domain-containing protein [Thermofilum sp.]